MAHLDLWRVALDQPADPVDLSADEVTRAAQYAFAPLRQRFIAGRTALRRVLSHYLDLPPAQVHLTYSRQGKPLLADQPLYFNASHSENLMIIGVTTAGEIGVDVEAIRPLHVDLMVMVQDLFSPLEKRTLAGLRGEAQQHAFFRAWTYKEAYIKGIGTGFHTPLYMFDVPLLAEAGQVGAWQLKAFDPGSGFLGAVAIRTESFPEMQFLDYTP